MRSFRQRSFLMLLALHDVIDDDWLVHAVSFIFPYFCVYFHLFAQAKRLGRRRLLLLLLLLFSFLRVSRRRRRRCYPPPRFREEELIHQSSSSPSSSRGRGRGREKSSRRSTHRALLLLKCALFLTSAFQSIEYFFLISLSTKKNKNEQKKLQGWNYSFFFFSHHLCRCFCCFCSPPLPKATFFSADKDTTKSSSFLSPFLVFFRE